MEGWWKTELINVEKVRRFIAEFRPHHVHLFSFAVWNEQEREKFNVGTRPMLEEALGIKLSLVLTVDEDITPVCCKMMGVSIVDFSEMSAFWGKQGAFRLCMRNHATNMARHNLKVHAVLLDDVVYNETITWPDLGATIQQLNIDQLYEPH